MLISTSPEDVRARIVQLLQAEHIDTKNLEVERGYRFNYLVRINGKIIGEYSSQSKKLILWDNPL